MIYLRSLGKMSLRTPGNCYSDLLTVFYIFLTILFRFPCFFSNYDLLTKLIYELPVDKKSIPNTLTHYRVFGTPRPNVFVPIGRTACGLILNIFITDALSGSVN